LLLWLECSISGIDFSMSTNSTQGWLNGMVKWLLKVTMDPKLWVSSDFSMRRP